MNNMGSIVEQVQKLQQELKQKAIEVGDQDGNFSVLINGHQEVLEVKFNPAILKPEHAGLLQAAVAGTINRAIAESKQMIKNELAKITGGMNLPDFSGMF